MKAYIIWDRFQGAKVYFMSEPYQGKVMINRQVANEGKLVWEQEAVSITNPSMLPPVPTFEINFIEAREFLVSLGEACQTALKYADQFSPTHADVLQGELKATKEHLADMRRLVFDEVPKDSI